MPFKLKKMQVKRLSRENIKKKHKKCQLQILRENIQIKILITIIKINRIKKIRKKEIIFELNEH